MRLSAVAGLLGVFAVVAYSQTRTEMIAFVRVNVVDVDAGSVRPNMLVLLEGDRISRVEPYREGSTPSTARVIPADGKFLIPGLWDMHVHAYDEEELALFVANGVTGIRQMLGQQRHHEWASRIASGDLIGPRQVIGSPLLDGPKPSWPRALPVANETEAGPTVERVVRDGAEFIKVYSLLPRDAYFGIAAKSKMLRVPFAGHIPYTVTLLEASAAGQASLEHMPDIMFAASSREEEFRRELNAAAKSVPSGAALRRIRDGQGPAIIASYDSGKADRLFETLAKNGTTIAPTLVAERAFAFLDDASFTGDPRLKYTPGQKRRSWDPSRDVRLTDRTPDQWKLEKTGFTTVLQVIGDMHRKGVRLLAGTDMGNPFCFPGFSLHDELALLVEGGLTPLDALRAATINPARYLARLSSSGTIEAGKLADAVLLDADPLINITNTTKIAGVVSGGRYFDRPALDHLLTAAGEWANRLPIGETLAVIIRERGIRDAVLEYERLKQTQSSKYDFAEVELNRLGYQLLRDQRVDDAIEIFKLNVQAYPAGSNTYDSLAEAYVVKGMRELAIQNYERSSQLDPTNSNAVEQLRKLRAN